MMRPWIPWLLVFLVVLGAGEGLSLLLQRQGAEMLAGVIALAGRIAAVIWVIVGMVRWQSVGWVRGLTRFALMTLLAFLLYSFFDVLGQIRFARWVASIYLMGLLFAVVIRLSKVILSANTPIVAVAKTVVNEAMNSKMALSFIIALFILLPSIQIFTVATETRVEYQVKSFLVFSLLITGSLLGVLTVLQGAWTVTQEREAKQIFLTLTKPVGRMQYLLGKWLGMVVLNAALILVASVGIYRFTMELKLADQFFDTADMAAVDQRVLVARQRVEPVPNNDKRNLDDWILAEARSILEDTDLQTLNDIRPNHFADISRQQRQRWLSVGGMGAEEGEPSGREYLFVDIPQMWNPRPVRAAIDRHYLATSLEEKNQAVQDIRAGFERLEGNPYKGQALDLVQDLENGEAKHQQLAELMHDRMPVQKIQLQIKPRTGGETEQNRVRMILSANGVLIPPPHYDRDLFSASDFEVQRRNNSWSFAENVFSVVDIPAWYMEADQALVLRIDNVTATGTSVSFHKDNGLVLLYRAGGFFDNFAKAIFLLWVRLMFVAMVAVAAGSFLSFPVAALCAFVVFFGAVGSSYLLESLHGYSTINVEYGSFAERIGHFLSSVLSKVTAGEYYDVIKILISAIGQLWLFVVPDLSQANGTNMIRDGLQIPTKLVLGSFGRVVLLSTSLACLLGWTVFRRRELAKVVV